MSESKSSNGGNIGFVGLLTILFIALKLCNVITWSWWWVLSPMWILLLLVLITTSIFGIVYALTR